MGGDIYWDLDMTDDLPWHIGFHNEIADNLRKGIWQLEMVRHNVVNICAKNGRHVAWACSRKHAEMIIAAVNRTAIEAKYEKTNPK